MSERKDFNDGKKGNALSPLQADYRQRRNGLFMVRGIPRKSLVADHCLDARLPGR